MTVSDYNLSHTSPETIQEARQADYIGFLHRHPFSTDAWELGYATGIREDYNQFEGRQPRNVDYPVVILDNDFENPDIDRYLTRFQRYDPSVAILGDAYNAEDAHQYQELIHELSNDHPHKDFIVVPKCSEAFDILDQDTVLGYPIGYSTLEPSDFSTLSDWRDRRIHLLGASPPKQYEAIQELTQPTVTGEPPADITGLDWNGVHKVAYMGEHWSRDGWHNADHLSIRETVRKSLTEMKAFWEEKQVWPSVEPREIYGEAVRNPDEFVFLDRGADPIRSREELEDAVVNEYRNQGKLAFDSDSYRRFVEHREGWQQI